MKTLHLPIKKKWFDMIASGEKPEEYRNITDHWASRIIRSLNSDGLEWQVWQEMLHDLRNPFKRHKDLKELMDFFGVEFKKFDNVLFRNGYRKDSPTLLLPCNQITVGTGKEELGAENGKHYFIIHLWKNN